jgi:hypothetical protein
MRCCLTIVWLRLLNGSTARNGVIAGQVPRQNGAIAPLPPPNAQTITYRAGSAPEAVADGETGFVWETLRETIAAVGEVEGLGRAACRRRVGRLFSPAMMADGYRHACATLTA